ncbi:MBL fold metallo-hydrolase [Bacillus sp. DNRA2]|uniref:MBL fold metallo-hydrolase n=1 Tax=Bacillus sp. DNRA2 TaxID=2723053 RepID=UPI00145D5B44|nr:MBL fold metallo-hydrolase [Bacillus sp. DNRA2]NMD70231.1 MBL fold metallo-hydrolase [Bacillus sp. DNRA2]
MTEWKNGIAKITLPTPFPVGDVNVFLIKAERLTLVDAGTNNDESWAAFVKQLNDLHLTPNDIEQVIITHHHPDHVGLLAYFPESVEVYGHHLNQPWLTATETFIEDNEMFFERTLAEFGVSTEFLALKHEFRRTTKYFCNRVLTGHLAEGDTAPGLNGWKILETPGHASSHIGLLRESDGLFVGGDLLLPHISPNPILEPPLSRELDRPKPQLELNASLKKLTQYPIQTVLPGHGDEINDVVPLIEKRLSRQHERAMLVKKWLQAEDLTVFEVCQRLFPHIYERELILTLSETAAQIDYLLSLQEITMINKEFPYRYRAN